MCFQDFKYLFTTGFGAGVLCCYLWSIVINPRRIVYPTGVMHEEFFTAAENLEKVIATIPDHREKLETVNVFIFFNAIGKRFHCSNFETIYEKETYKFGIVDMEVKNFRQDGVIHGCYGYGPTIKDAIEDFCKNISQKRLILNAYDKNKRHEISVTTIHFVCPEIITPYEYQIDMIT